MNIEVTLVQVIKVAYNIYDIIFFFIDHIASIS